MPDSGAKFNEKSIENITYCAADGQEKWLLKIDKRCKSRNDSGVIHKENYHLSFLNEQFNFLLKIMFVIFLFTTIRKWGR